MFPRGNAGSTGKLLRILRWFGSRVYHSCARFFGYWCLLTTFLDAADAKVISVVVTDLKENTYYAKVHLSYEDSEYSVDSRPSDAIALALRAKAPIFVTDDVIRKHGNEEMDRWLENLKPEDFGKYDA